LYPLKLHSSTLRGREGLGEGASCERRQARPPSGLPAADGPGWGGGRPSRLLLHDGGSSEAGGGWAEEEERMTGNGVSVRRAQQAGTAPPRSVWREGAGRAVPPRLEGREGERGRAGALAPGGLYVIPLTSRRAAPHAAPSAPPGAKGTVFPSGSEAANRRPALGCLAVAARGEHGVAGGRGDGRGCPAGWRG